MAMMDACLCLPTVMHTACCSCHHSTGTEWLQCSPHSPGESILIACNCS